MESRQVDKQLSIKSEQLLNLRAEVITQMDMAWSGDSQRDMRDLWKPQLDQAESKLMAAERELQAERALSASTQQALEVSYTRGCMVVLGVRVDVQHPGRGGWLLTLRPVLL